MNCKDVVNDIKASLDRAEPPITGDCCIYKVPFDICLLNQDAYTPKVVSIGPIHHHHPRLQNMERHKLIYFKKFLERARAHVTLDTLVIHVEQAEPNVRRSYADTVNLTKEDLVKVILIDSCFIIELFLRCCTHTWSEGDTSLSKPWLVHNIRSDLLLLENQLPFFVLESLFNRAFPSGSGRIHSFLVLTFDYFDYYNSRKLGSDNVTIKHFTDLLRTFSLQPRERRPRRVEVSVAQIPSATELLAAGARIKVNTESNCLLDLKFSRGVLEIPKLYVSDWTEILLRNLVALELCHYPRESYIIDYIAVLDFLINTNRDVDALIHNGVLVNLLGDSVSVANLYNGLWKNVTHLNFNSHYSKLCQDLNDFCRDPRHKLRATLRRDYGNTPWQAAASIAGIVLLLLSLLQSVCSVLQVVQHK